MTVYIGKTSRSLTRRLQCQEYRIKYNIPDYTGPKTI